MLKCLKCYHLIIKFSRFCFMNDKGVTILLYTLNQLIKTTSYFRDVALYCWPYAGHLLVLVIEAECSDRFQEV